MKNWGKIDKKKKELEKARPFSPHTLKSLREKMALEWTHHSNAIEGNTLTLKETKVVLEGVTIGGKSIKEHLEALNHHQAIQYLATLVQKNTKLTEQKIKKIHAIVLQKIDPDNAGTYRQEQVFVTGARHIPPPGKNVPGEMKKLLHKYYNPWQKFHPVERASLLHIEFVKIHPFIDGNGRTARLLQNFELMKYGYPPIIIKKQHRLKYYQALDKAHTTRQITDFLKLSAECLDKSLDLYLKTINSEK